jgi:hypothetical protein
MTLSITTHTVCLLLATMVIATVVANADDQGNHVSIEEQGTAQGEGRLGDVPFHPFHPRLRRGT